MRNQSNKLDSKNLWNDETLLVLLITPTPTQYSTQSVIAKSEDGIFLFYAIFLSATVAHLIILTGRVLEY